MADQMEQGFLRLTPSPSIRRHQLRSIWDEQDFNMICGSRLILLVLMMLVLSTVAVISESGACYLDDHQDDSVPDLRILDQVLAAGQLPSSIDWRQHGAVTSVKQQGELKACWAFAAVGAVEGFHKIKTGNLVDLSVQQVIDCNFNRDKEPGDHGGKFSTAFKYIESMGLVREQDYPYRQVQGKCRWNIIYKPVANIFGFKYVQKRNETALMASLLKQPVAVGLALNQNALRNYRSGSIYRGPCEERATHAMLAVGYGSDKDGDFWILKNSWGQKWGDNGYLKFERGSNLCGVANRAAYPVDAE